MEFVAKHLAQTALETTSSVHRDDFARASFNRYYYAMFLENRRLLKDFNEKWGRLAHAAIPEVLKNGLRTLFINELKSQLYRESEKRQLIGEVKHLTRLLSDLLESARTIRVLADYEPERKVEFRNGYFALGGRKVSEARSWVAETRKHCTALRAKGIRLGLIIE